jgi:hypothetical protein
MPVVPQLLHAVKSREASAPKSILGFFGIVFLILVAAALTAVVALASEASSRHLIGPILIFIGVFAVLLVVGVGFVAWKDPTKLMLGQVNTRDLIEYRQLTLGSSSTGERLETVAVAQPPNADLKESGDLLDPGRARDVDSGSDPIPGDEQ